MSLSLFIPRVFSNISEKRIQKVFHDLDYGKVNHVDFVEKNGTSGKYKSVYIHFDYWYDNQISQRFQDKVRDPYSVARIVYDDPWFWIVLENKLACNGEKEKDQEEEEEDAELEQLLDEMDETAEWMSEESFDFVSADYAIRTEYLNHCLNYERYQRQESEFHLMRDYDRKLSYYKMECDKQKQDIRNLIEDVCEKEKASIKIKTACVEKMNMQEDFYCNKIATLEMDVVDLQMQLAHFKEVLAQYQPDLRFQNKELVQY
jgi:hypothetical protein